MMARDMSRFLYRHARRMRLPFRREQLETSREHHSRAQLWFESSIATWEREGRIATQEAVTLRAEITEPQFLAVLPHFGVLIAMSAVLRFPVGSIVRASYVALNLVVATMRLLTRSIDRHAWRQAFGIHSPLVILVAGMPGIGTFAYLASQPMRAHHLLLRVGVDAVLMKFPKRLYEGTGLRWVVARPMNAVAGQDERTPLRLNAAAQSIVLGLGLFVGGLFTADLVTQVAAELRIVDPDAMGVRQILRMLDLGAEASFGTWYQVLALVFLSVILAAIGFAKQQQGDRFTRHWFILALLSLGFSLDEQVKLHDAGGGTETIRENLGLAGPIFYGWVIVGLLSVLVVGLYFRSFIAELPQVTRRLFVLAGGLFVGGEIVMESISGWYADVSGSDTNLTYQTITSFEEFFGMAGILVAIAATLHYAQVHFGEVHVALHDKTTTENTAQSVPMLPVSATSDGNVFAGNPTAGFDDEGADRARQVIVV